MTIRVTEKHWNEPVLAEDGGVIAAGYWTVGYVWEDATGSRRGPMRLDLPADAGDAALLAAVTAEIGD